MAPYTALRSLWQMGASLPVPNALNINFQQLKGCGNKYMPLPLMLFFQLLF